MTTMTTQSSGTGVRISPLSLLTHLLVGLAGLQLGLVIGGYTVIHTGSDAATTVTTSGDSSSSSTGANADAVVGIPCGRDTTDATIRELRLKLAHALAEASAETTLPETLQGFVAGMGRVDRDEFIQRFDVGVPWDAMQPGNKEVLLLYNHPLSLPRNGSSDASSNTIPRYESINDAVQNCHQMKIVLQKPNQPNVCWAVVGQWDSHHVQKLMRLPPENSLSTKKAVSEGFPLRYVSRNHLPNGRQTRVPTGTSYFPILHDYLGKLEATLARLSPVAAQAADPHNSLVVLVCNHGQSELLWNFVCAARSRSLNLAHVLVFATDSVTYDLAVAMGLHAMDVQNAFGDMPTVAARRYGDAAFTGMMMSKVYVMHLLVTLGYNVLFQDVDVVWYQDPLAYFNNDQSDFDLFFQDDGAHSPRYAPYSPNTGLYYVRHNERTEFFFSTLARMGDLIQASGSHQSALNALLAEHASWRGLKVKVFGTSTDQGELFPGGYHFHRRKGFMKEMLVTKSVHPYVFHMSWTMNSINKQRFFRQMGDWFVQEACIGKTLDDIGTDDSPDVVSKCCAAEALVSCHYSDKPSIIPCKDSPSIDKGGKPFW